MSEVELRALTGRELVERRDEAAAVFAAALGFGVLEPRVLAFPEMVRRHAEQPEFRAFGAFDGGELVGFSEGHLSQPGQWWHDEVAARLDPAQRRRWLDDAFELVELHVLPAYQGRGIGGRLHDLVLEGVPHRTAVLSTRRGETRAMALYRARGWEVLADNVRFPGNPTPFRILGLDLSTRSASGTAG